MGYRDENEALRARVAELQGELADAERRLGHRPAQGTPPDPSWLDRALGASAIVRDERWLEGSLDDDRMGSALEAVSKHLRTTGRVYRYGTRLTWTATVGTSRFVELSWVQDHGSVHFQLTERNNLRGTYFGSVLGGLGGGLAWVAVMAAQRIGVHPLFAIVLWGVAVVAFARALYVRATLKRRADLIAASDVVASAWHRSESAARASERPQRVAAFDEEEPERMAEEVEHAALAEAEREAPPRKRQLRGEPSASE